MAGPPRPITVTVTAWVVIVVDLVVLAAVVGYGGDRAQALAEVYPLPAWAILAWLAGRHALLALCGAGLLLRQNWARWVLIVLAALVIVVIVLLRGLDFFIEIAIGVYLIIVYILVTPKASDYFTGGNKQARPRGQGSPQGR